METSPSSPAVPLAPAAGWHAACRGGRRCFCRGCPGFCSLGAYSRGGTTRAL